jgi:hypothetical protein
MVIQPHERVSLQSALGHRRAVRLVRVREVAQLEEEIVSMAAVVQALKNSRCPKGRRHWGTRTGSPAKSVSLSKDLWEHRRSYLELVDEHTGVEVVVDRALAARRRARRDRRAVRLHVVLQLARLRNAVFSAQPSPTTARGHSRCRTTCTRRPGKRTGSPGRR